MRKIILASVIVLLVIVLVLVYPKKITVGGGMLPFQYSYVCKGVYVQTFNYVSTDGPIGGLCFGIIKKVENPKGPCPQDMNSSNTWCDDSLNSKHDENNLIQENKNPENQNGLVCHDSPNYLAISRPVVNNPGSDVLVKYKTNVNQTIPCNYSVEKNDFELKNIGGADYFMAFEGKFLIMDSGTGVDNRGITVYDLSKQKEVFSDEYSSGEPVIENNTITYWINTNEPTTIQNCPKLYNSGGVIVSQTLFDLSTLIKKDLGNERCVYQE